MTMSYIVWGGSSTFLTNNSRGGFMRLALGVLSQCKGLGESTTPHGINKPNIHTYAYE